MTTLTAVSAAPVPPRLTAAELIQRAAFTTVGRVPKAILRRLIPPTVNADGDVMEPEIALLMRVTAAEPDFSDGTVADARAAMENDCRVFADRSADADVAVDTNIVLRSGIRASLYRPRVRSNGLVLFLHGGGFVLGSRSAYDSPARLIASRAGVNVLSIEYRLAPEAPFPAAPDDAMEAWQFAVEGCADWGVDPQRIVLLGDSAGANLCAVLSNQLQHETLRPRMQVLMYPVVDAAGDYRSREEFADNPALTVKQMDWLAGLYVTDARDRSDPRVSPILAEDLSGVPATLITVAGFDPLRDEAIAYASRLNSFGVPTRLLREGGLVHGYLSMTQISPAAREAVNRVADAIGRAVR
ncbi:alpha/beta hydrolase [Mycolicibacterium brisbanense]|uniref:Probable lipase/esterase n=1 Tax=Mycolicibacterium brisbanense TaxID=146020 RepID=A0A117I6I7_9MYCO|nr:alpha/beta hydrolase [Mycolicibacterium brisbanense]MCV7157501.1 alpha/beta hydrolase [Mycolicibacterium brisbanense]GAS90137.1 probable lipase/esterase [Mycolicibacterium brisbanense]